MTPRMFGKIDRSVSWPRCGRPGCDATHLPEYDCPPTGVWLVRRGCSACGPGGYCRAHDAHVR